MQWRAACFARGVHLGKEAVLEQEELFEDRLEVANIVAAVAVAVAVDIIVNRRDRGIRCHMGPSLWRGIG